MARIFLTGGLRLEGPEGAVVDADLPGHQGRVAFAALVLERRPLTHDELADIVWDEEPPARWKAALTPVVSKIRSLVGRTGLDGPAVVGSLGGTWSVVPPPDAWIDVEDAVRRLDRAEGALRHGDLETAAAEATVASSILRRPFLAGIDNLWADRVRRSHAEGLHRCSIALASAWSGLGHLQLAATVAEEAVRLDPLRETGHRLLMEIERDRGDGAAALRAFERCRAVLRDELDTAPSPSTISLAESLRGGAAEVADT